MATPLSDTPLSPLTTIAVVGLGTMGTGIAEVLARAGREVIGIDISDAAAAPGRRRPRGLHRPRRASASGSPSRSARTPSPASAPSPICRPPPTPTSSSRSCRSRTRSSSRSSARWTPSCAPSTILATGTNALSVTRLAADSAHPERVLGLHFFNPAPGDEAGRGRLLGADRAGGRRRRSPTLARELGKEPVAVGDRPGFVADGLLFGYLNQAAAMYEAKYASREDIDAAMRLGCGLPMGPLALLDLIGIDTARTVLEAMYAESHDRLHAPAPDPQAAQRGGPDRPQVGPRLLHLRGPGQRRPSCRTR